MQFENEFRSTLRPFTTALIIMAVLCSTAEAQPDLTFKRVTLNWPTVALYFTVGCDGNPAYNMTKQDFRVFENGVEIKDFTFWCPDPTIRCAFSVSLVFSASGSMSGSGQATAKQVGHGFIDLMDGLIDEATILWFTSVVSVFQQMSTNKPMLHSAVDALPASGGSALWDGAYAGLIELINNGVNQCRAMILVTNGYSYGSTRQMSEVLDLAIRHRIRVFSVGLGSVANGAALDSIAQLTGGEYFHAPNGSQSGAISAELYSLISSYLGFPPVITYERDCADGGVRSVQLGVNNFCGGSDTVVTSYTAPLDSSTFSSIHLKLGDVNAGGGNDFVVPLNLITPIQNKSISPFSFTLSVDTSCVKFVTASTASSTLLSGMPLSVMQVPGGVSISVNDEKNIDGTGLLMELTLHASAPVDSVQCQIRATNVMLANGCFRPSIEPSAVRIINLNIPIITADGPQSFCEGDSVVLSASGGFWSYLWSTGQTSQNITVRHSGTFWVRTVDQQGVQATSGSVQVFVQPAPAPVIMPSGTIRLCKGGSVELDAGGGYTSYQWNNGKQQRRISVSTAGVYAVTVTSSYGCSGTSAPVIISIGDSLQPVIRPEGPTSFCDGGSVVLDAGAGYATYRWSNGATTQKIMASNSGVFAVTVTDDKGCVGISDLLSVEKYQAPEPKISPTGPIMICEGDSVLLDAGPGYSSYQWNDGTTSSMKVVRNAGKYFVTVHDIHACIGHSDTIDASTLPSPAKPIIQRTVDLLTTGLASSYQWYRNGIPIPSAVNQFHIVTEPGIYQVRISNIAGCTAMSDPFDVTVTGIEAIPSPSAAAELHVYPEPADNVLHVAIRSAEAGSMRVIISDLSGRYDVLHDGAGTPPGLDLVVPLRERSKGVYYVIVFIRDMVLSQRVTKL